MRTRPCRSFTAAIAGVLCVLIGEGPTDLAAGPQTPSLAGHDYFRVDMEIQQDGERTVMRRYVDGARTRMEIDVDGEKIVTIAIGDAEQTTYTLMPDERRAMKMSGAAMDSAASRGRAVARGRTPLDVPAQAEAAGPEPELIGTDTIDGKPVEKFRVRMPEGDGTIWVDQATQLPLRMEAAGAIVTMRNYDFSRPAPELFTVPKGYEVTDLGEMMKSVSAGRMIAGGLAGSMGARMGGEVAGNVGAGIGAAFGGPIGAMIGRFIGQKIGRKIGQSAGSAIAR